MTAVASWTGDVPSRDLPDRRSCPDWALVACDVEASGLFVDDGARVSIVSVAWREGGDGAIRSLVFPFDQGTLDKVDLPKRWQGDGMFGPGCDNLDTDEWVALMRWLSGHRLVNQNWKYDQHIIDAGIRGREGSTGGKLAADAWHWDTMIGTWLLYPREKQIGLKPTCNRLYGETETDEAKQLAKWLERHFPKWEPRYDLAPWDLIGPYAGKDAELALRLAEDQIDATDQSVVGWDIMEREQALVHVLYRMERRGIGYDVAAAQREMNRLSDLIDRAERQVKDELGIMRVTVPAVKNRLFGTGPDSLGVVPPGPKASLSAADVRVLVARGTRGMAAYSEWAKLVSARDKWYDAWWRLVGDDGRLRTSFRQCKTENTRGDKVAGTVSGRLAVERVQLHAIPHDYQLPPGLAPVRSFMRERDGCVLFEADLSQAEMRVAASVAECARLTAAFEAGLDAHDTTTQLVWNIGPDDPDWKRNRNVAKRLNFGTVYGAGAQTIADQVLLYTGIEMTKEEATVLLTRFRSVYPEIQRTARRLERQWVNRGYIVLAGGRKRWFTDDERANFEERKAFNAAIQGGVAEGMKIAMLRIEAELPGVLLGQIHDSLIGRARAGDEDRVIERVKAITCDTFNELFRVPFLMDHKIWWRTSQVRVA